MKRIAKSGAAAAKYNHFSLAFALWKGEKDMVCEFRRANNTMTDGHDENELELQEVYDQISEDKYIESDEKQRALAKSKSKVTSDKELKRKFMETSIVTQNQHQELLVSAKAYLDQLIAKNDQNSA